MSDTATASSIIERYSYKTRYIPSIEDLLQKIADKTVIPHQLEVQPGRISGEALCWMKCPYCYGGSAKNTHERLSPDRMLEIIKESALGPHGSVPKIIFAGYATDPLNYEHIDDLLEQAIKNRQITGFHTKALRVSDRFVSLISSTELVPLSYFSVSVDAGFPESYNKTHGVDSKADIYSKVIGNINHISEARARTGTKLDISATYLITSVNNSLEEIEKSINDLKSAGVDLIRFCFPQVPRGKEDNESISGLLLSRSRIRELCQEITPLLAKMDSPTTRVMVLNSEDEFNINEARTFPCFARFVFPSLGYDGYLSHCSESAAPHFREMTLGNLAERGFWETYYDYDPTGIPKSLSSMHALMAKFNCKCDRKEHLVNAIMRDHFKDQT